MAYPTERQRAGGATGAVHPGPRVGQQTGEAVWWGRGESSGTNGSYMTKGLWGEKELVNKTDKYKHDNMMGHLQ